MRSVKLSTISSATAVALISLMQGPLPVRGKPAQPGIFGSC